MQPNIDEIYLILRAWALRNEPKSYLTLSQEYQTRTGQWFEPHGSWDHPLGHLNRHLHSTLKAPALSAMVILKDANEPGGGFWGCAPNVPHRPKVDSVRIAEWLRIVDEVSAFPWPARLP